MKSGGDRVAAAFAQGTSCPRAQSVAAAGPSCARVRVAQATGIGGGAGDGKYTAALKIGPNLLPGPQPINIFLWRLRCQSA